MKNSYFTDRISDLKNKILQQLEVLKTTQTIYPSKDKVFRALEETLLEDLKVIVLGQDPYSDGSGIGLSFDNIIYDTKAQAEENAYVAKENKLLKEKGITLQRSPGHCYAKMSPSLNNVLTEIHSATNYEFITMNSDSYFQHLPAQGVLLLNTALTVEKGKPNSHKELWQDFTKELIQHISDSKDFVVFMLWGANALSYSAFIDEKKHAIIGTSHPSPLSNTKPCGKYPPFTGSNCFVNCNKLLTKKKLTPIQW